MDMKVNEAGDDIGRCGLAPSGRARPSTALTVRPVQATRPLTQPSGVSVEPSSDASDWSSDLLRSFAEKHDALLRRPAARDKPAAGQRVAFWLENWMGRLFGQGRA